MRRISKAALGFVAAVAVATFVGSASPALAQCSTCPTPTVAFSPVVQPVTVAPVVVAQPVRTGWYPGRMFDNWRLNRWSAHNPTLVAPATVQTVGFAPTVQTVGFAPTVQTVNFAPTVQTVNFAPAPFVTAYAPMQRTVVGFAPTATTVFSPAIIEPVVSGCSTCATASPCSSCAGATTVVEQATFTSPVSTVAPASGCSSCAAESSSGATYYQQAPASAPAPTYSPVPQVAAPPSSANPPIPQPALPANEPAPAAQNYGAQRPASETPAVAPAAEKSVIDPTPAPDADAATDGTSTSFEFKAPPLLGPQNDRTANRPTVDIHDAVYRQPARKANVSTTTVAKPVTPVSTAPQAAASGWTTVSER